MVLINSVTQWYGSLPGRSRLSISQELKASIPMAMLFGVMGNAYGGLAGHKALGMSDGMVALLQSMNQAGFIATGIGTSFLFKYSKSKSLGVIFVLVALVLLSISLLPEMWLTAYIFILQIYIIQTLLAFTGSVRSSIWRKNYPQEHRARIVVIIYLVLTTITSLSMSFYSYLMDKGCSYRLIYLICAGSSLLTAWFIAKVRVNGERYDIIQYRQETTGQSKKTLLFAGLKILKEDKRFRRYMDCQMINGICCLSIEAAMVVVIARIVDASADISHKWFMSGTLLAALPQLVCAFSSILWARYYDRNDIFTSRAMSAVVWSAGRLILVWGLYVQSIPIIMFSRVITGVGMGLGQLAWRLGHMSFAPADKDGIYMGTHQMMAGIRGMAAPFIGIYLLQFSWSGPNGAWITLVSAFGMLWSAWSFLKMRDDFNDLSKK